MDKATEYLRLLQEKNRLKKLMSAKSKDEKAKEELEKGFSTHFRGAHASKDVKAQAQVTATVKPVNLLSRLAQGSRFGWGGERSKGEAAGVESGGGRSEAHEADNHYESNEGGAATDYGNAYAQDEGGGYSEYESDFENASDSEVERGQPAPAARRHMMSTVREEVDEQEAAEQAPDSMTGCSAVSPVSASASPAVAAAPSSLSMTASLDVSLQVRVKELSAAQKLKLLQLLEQDAAVATSPLRVKKHDGAVASPAPTPPASSHPAPSAGIDAAETITQPAAVSSMVRDLAGDSVLVRVRVTSSWNVRARFVSLRSVRLRLRGGEDVLLAGWTCRLLSGLVPLPATHESVRGLDEVVGLRGQGAVRPLSAYLGANNSAAAWKAPLSNDSPLELQLEGRLPADILHRLSDLQLLLWNCTAPPLNSAAARDVDVFVGSRCVWSGVLEAEPTAASPQPAVHGKEGEPSLVLSLFEERRGSTASKPPQRLEVAPAVAEPAWSHPTERAVGRYDHLEESDGARPSWLAGLRGPAHPEADMETGPVYMEAARTMKTPTRASAGRRAVSEVQAAAATGTASQSPKKSLCIGRRSRRGDDAPIEDEVRTLPDQLGSDVAPADTIPVGQADGATGSPAGRAARRKASRRDRSAALRGANGEGLPRDAALNEPSGGFSPEGGSLRKKEREAELKKSLDTLAFNDKFNLGRLSATKLPRESPHRYGDGSGEEHYLEESAGAMEESVGAVPFAEDSLGAPTTPLRSTSHFPHALQHSPAVLSPAHRSAHSEPMLSPAALSRAEASLARAEKDSTRTAKIDLVQEKINSTIAGLAQIMSGIPAAGAGRNRGVDRTDAVEVSAQPPQHTDPASGVPAKGKVLTIEVLSSWGDEHYVGLNGIELYGPSGHMFALSSAAQPRHSAHGSIASIAACPSDLNILPEHAGDPRRVQNLLDGLSFSKNDLHSWLVPQLPYLRAHHPDIATTLLGSAAPEERLAVITLEFDRAVELSMCRVFNYNRSRARNQRGVRTCRFLLDGHVLWQGEVKKADGQLVSEEAESQVIFLAPGLSASEREGLQRHVVRARRAEGVEEEEAELGEASGDMDLEQSWAEMSSSRPKTSSGVPPPAVAGSVAHSELGHAPVPVILKNNVSEPPLRRSADLEVAAARREVSSKPIRDVELDLTALAAAVVPVALSSKPQSTVGASAPAAPSSGATTANGKLAALISCRVLRVSIESTWGDPSYVGLCGVELLVGPAQTPLKLTAQQLTAKPKDLSDVGCFDDPRVLTNLINGLNNTADDTKMWLIPFTKGSEHYLQVDLGRPQEVSGIRFWNYNKASEHVLRGCRQVSISADGKTLFRCLLRPGPGCDGVRFQQDVLFGDVLDILGGNRGAFSAPSPLQAGRVRPTSYITPAIRQDCETPLLPTGMLWRFTLFDNYNDQYFVGLDAIEFFDAEGRLIDAFGMGAHVQAVPFSVQDVQPAVSDPRQPAQLIAGAGRALGCGWLAPLSRCMTPMERAACVQRLQGQAQHSSTTAFSFPVNNVVMVMFPQPVTVSAIKLYNYSKTPSRGARDYLVETDGLYLYQGTLSRADKEKTLPLPVRPGMSADSKGSSRGQSVLFTNDPRVTQAHRDTVSYCGAGEQDLLCINERQVMVRSKGMYDQEPPNTSLEGVQSDLQKRPMTAAHGWKGKA